MNKKIISLLLFLLSTQLFAQDKTIQTEILNYQDSKSMVITKGRALLLDKFLAGDYVKVTEIKDYLIKDVEDQNYMALYPVEYWLIMYRTCQFNELLDVFLLYNNEYWEKLKKKIRPQNDLLYSKLYEKSLESQVLLESFIETSNVSSEGKSFLMMQLRKVLMSDEAGNPMQDTLNTMAEAFLKQYPQSSYTDYIRSTIRYKIVQSDWGLGIEYFSGYGIFTNGLADHFTNSIPIGFTFDVEYKKLTLGLRNYIGLNGTKVDISNGESNWLSGSQARVYVPELALGYIALDNEKMKVSPFVGIASTCFSPTEYDIEEQPDLKHVLLNFTSTYTFGVSLDFKFGKPRMNFITQGPEQSFWFLRLRYAYSMPRFDRYYPNFDGMMHNITIGLGGFGRKLKRDF